MDGSVILLPIPTAPNGFTKSHIHDYISHDHHWYNQKENIIRDDVWGKSELKIHHHQSPPPTGPPPNLLPPQGPPPTTALPAVTSAPPSITAPITSPPPSYVAVPPQHLNHQSEILNFKNSTKQQQSTIHGVSTTPSSNAMVNVGMKKEHLAAPDLES